MAKDWQARISPQQMCAYICVHSCIQNLDLGINMRSTSHKYQLLIHLKIRITLGYLTPIFRKTEKFQRFITEKFKRYYTSHVHFHFSVISLRKMAQLTGDLIARAVIGHSFMKPSTSTEVYILSLLQQWLSTFQCCYFLIGILLLYESL